MILTLKPILSLVFNQYGFYTKNGTCEKHSPVFFTSNVAIIKPIDFTIEHL